MLEPVPEAVLPPRDRNERPSMTLFGKDFVRSLVLGFALGSGVMALTFGVQPAQAQVPAVHAAAQR